MELEIRKKLDNRITDLSRFALKKDLADTMGISMGCLQKYLNKKYFKELELLGYKKNDKLLTPKQLQFLNEKLDFLIKE